MATDTADRADVEPVTEETHDNSWSANLERDFHEDDRELVIEQAKEAIRHTTTGNHVNLVTHGNHGQPESYLYEALESTFDGVRIEYVEQCGCGGHVSRVHV